MRLAFLLATIGLALTVEAQAQPMGGLAQIAVIDRETGVALSPHYYRGEYWIAGRPGAKYSIEIHNRLGERLLAVTSVDGVNVLSGETAAWDQAGYVFEPGERYQVTGWRKSDAEVAAFTFTESPNSYAERTGRPANVGVIGVALYRERPPQAWASPRLSEEKPTNRLDAPAARRRRRRRLPHAARHSPASGTCAEARHRPRRTRILVCQPHGVCEAAAPAERSNPHSLRQPRQLAGDGSDPAGAPAAAVGQPIPGRPDTRLRAGSAGMRQECHNAMR
jgi:hypothetical protein